MSSILHSLPTSQYSVEGFLELSTPTLDVRSPAEYAHAHLPGAINLPLFTDRERHEVGCCYAEKGEQAALSLGLQLVGPKLAGLVAAAQNQAMEGSLRLYCWRGGMRSQAVAQLLTMAGLRVERLTGGYKAFRRWALQQLKEAPSLRVLGGFTGSGKSAVLRKLSEFGEPILDLEELANHCGSTFGGIGKKRQPSQEYFENQIALKLHQLGDKRPIWIEDESRTIGQCQLPPALYAAIRSAPLLLLQRPDQERRERLLLEYGELPILEMSAATERLRKRLGGERCRQIQDALSAGKAREAMLPLLEYYDRTYSYSLQQRPMETISINLSGASISEWAYRVLEIDWGT